MSIIDFFDELTSDRSYKKAVSDEDVVQMMLDQRSKHFDPQVVDVFLANVNEFIAIRNKINLNPISYSQLVNCSLEELMCR